MGHRISSHVPNAKNIASLRRFRADEWITVQGTYFGLTSWFAAFSSCLPSKTGMRGPARFALDCAASAAVVSENDCRKRP
jgi:hypothetical protein